MTSVQHLIRSATAQVTTRGNTRSDVLRTRDSNTSRTEVEQEEWRPIVGREGCYEVSDQGHIRSLDRVVKSSRAQWPVRGRILNPSPLRSGHLVVDLGRAWRSRRVHRLVLEAFAGPCPSGMEALHGDGDPSNNRIQNLRWGTRSENIQDAIRHGTHPATNRSACPRGHALREPNLVRSQFPRRECLACARARSLVYRRQHAVPFEQEANRRYAEILGGKRYRGIDASIAAEVQRRYASGGVTQRALAQEFGISQSSVDRLVASTRGTPS